MFLYFSSSLEHSYQSLTECINHGPLARSLSECSACGGRSALPFCSSWTELLWAGPQLFMSISSSMYEAPSRCLISVLRVSEQTTSPWPSLRCSHPGSSHQGRPRGCSGVILCNSLCYKMKSRGVSDWLEATQPHKGNTGAKGPPPPSRAHPETSRSICCLKQEGHTGQERGELPVLVTLLLNPK